MNFQNVKYVTNDAGENCIVEATFLDGNNQVLRTSHIPMDVNNADYQAILEWEAIPGNDILDAD